MKAEFKKLWTDALRSGEYRQGQGKLCAGDLFCCLGVAFDVLIEDDWIEDQREKNRWLIRDKHERVPNGSHLPEWVRRRILLSTSDHAYLINMNDDHDMTFDGIADWIERRL